jgi:hypothetical protein
MLRALVNFLTKDTINDTIDKVLKYGGILVITPLTQGGLFVTRVNNHYETITTLH